MRGSVIQTVTGGITEHIAEATAPASPTAPALIMQSYAYTPFGDQLGAKTSGYGYNGEHYDAATGLLNLRARQYEPAQMRFSQPDIVRGYATNPQTLNRYGYGVNNPITYGDPSGQIISRLSKTAKKIGLTIKNTVTKTVKSVAKAISSIKRTVNVDPFAARNNSQAKKNPQGLSAQNGIKKNTLPASPTISLLSGIGKMLAACVNTLSNSEPRKSAETQKASILEVLFPSAKAEAVTYLASPSTQSITQALMEGYQPYQASLMWADGPLFFGDALALGGFLVVGAVGIIADAGRVFVESLPLPEDTGMTTDAFPLPSRGEIPSIESIPTVREVPINEGIDVVPEPRPLVPPDMPQSTPGPTIEAMGHNLPNQGLVDGGVAGAPPVAAGKQGKHVEGHNNSEASKSHWLEGTTGVQETQLGWTKGKQLPDGTRVWDTGSVVGSNGETGVRVHIDGNGSIHGYPVNPEQYLK